MSLLGPSSNSNNYQQPNQDGNQQHLTQQSTNVTNNITNNNFYGITTASSGYNRPMQKVIPTVVYLMSRIAVHMEIEG